MVAGDSAGHQPDYSADQLWLEGGADIGEYGAEFSAIAEREFHFHFFADEFFQYVADELRRAVNAIDRAIALGGEQFHDDDAFVRAPIGRAD